jgi:hypothetical protein
MECEGNGEKRGCRHRLGGGCGCDGHYRRRGNERAGLSGRQHGICDMCGFAPDGDLPVRSVPRHQMCPDADTGMGIDDVDDDGSGNADDNDDHVNDHDDSAIDNHHDN